MIYVSSTSSPPGQNQVEKRCFMLKSSLLYPLLDHLEFSHSSQRDLLETLFPSYVLLPNNGSMFHWELPVRQEGLSFA